MPSTPRSALAREPQRWTSHPSHHMFSSTARRDLGAQLAASAGPLRDPKMGAVTSQQARMAAESNSPGPTSALHFIRPGTGTPVSTPNVGSYSPAL